MSNGAIRPTLFTVLALAGTLLLSSCATTKLAEEWYDPGRTGPPFRKVLVIGVSNQTAVRRVFEDAFVRRIKVPGADAAPSYSFIAEGGKVERDRIVQAVAESRADAVLITRLVSRRQHSRTTPGSVNRVFVSHGSRGDIYAPYSAAWVRNFEPAIESEHETFILETNLYDVRSQAVAWTGSSETVDPDSPGQVAAELAEIVVKALEKAKLL